MAELEAAHKAKQQGVTRWRDAKEFVNLLELADVVDIQTAAEQYTGKWEQDEVDWGLPGQEHPGTRSSALIKRQGASRLERSHS